MESSKKLGRIDNIRPIKLTYDVFGNANSSSVLFEQGRTKVLVSITLQDGIPRFLRGKKEGWLTAEYSMLPCAANRRLQRDSSQGFRNNRSVEISRLIGRSLRTIIDFTQFPEKTIIVDCDVLTADGGTRVASISAASAALKLAQNRWLAKGLIGAPILKDEVAAISVGKVGDKFHLDLNFSLDSSADCDFNFVITHSGKLIEVQGTAEKEPLDFDDFEKLKKLAISGVKNVFNAIDNSFVFKSDKTENFKHNRPSMFSLGNRINN